VVDTPRSPAVAAKSLSSDCVLTELYQARFLPESDGLSSQAVGSFQSRDRQARAESRKNWRRSSPLSSEFRIAAEIDQMQRRELPRRWDRNLPSFPPTRRALQAAKSSGRSENVLAGISHGSWEGLRILVLQ